MLERKQPDLPEHFGELILRAEDLDPSAASELYGRAYDELLGVTPPEPVAPSPSEDIR
jgi:hypothetical protein